MHILGRTHYFIELKPFGSLSYNHGRIFVKFIHRPTLWFIFNVILPSPIWIFPWKNGCEIVVHDISCKFDFFHVWAILQMGQTQSTWRGGAFVSRIVCCMKWNCSTYPLLYVIVILIWYNHHNCNLNISLSFH